jgi:hypothetical protein
MPTTNPVIWGVETTLTHSTVPSYVSTTRLTGGGYVVAWVTGTTGFAQIYDVLGTPVGSLISNPNVNNMSVAPTNTGGFAIISQQASVGGTYLRALTYDSSGIQTHVGTTGPDPSLILGASISSTLLPDGNILIVTTQQDITTSYGISKFVLFADGTLGPSSPVNTTTSGDQFQPVVTVLANGGYVIA